MNTKQARVAEGTRVAAGLDGTRSDGISSRGYSAVSRFPGTRTRPGTGDTRSIRSNLAKLLQRYIVATTTASSFLLVATRTNTLEEPPPLPSHVCADYYVHVCPFKPTPRVFHRTIADLSLKATRRSGEGKRPNEKKLPTGVVTEKQSLSRRSNVPGRISLFASFGFYHRASRRIPLLGPFDSWLMGTCSLGGTNASKRLFDD